MHRVVFLLLLAAALSGAETVHVTVGDTGCIGRQQAVMACWAKIPGVTSVSVLPRHAKDPGAQRTFALISSGEAPSVGVLRGALGRRVGRYPILSFRTTDGRTARRPIPDPGA